jgi:hypothetical protein
MYIVLGVCLAPITHAGVRDQIVDLRVELQKEHSEIIDNTAATNSQLEVIADNLGESLGGNSIRDLLADLTGGVTGLSELGYLARAVADSAESGTSAKDLGLFLANDDLRSRLWADLITEVDLAVALSEVETQGANLGGIELDGQSIVILQSQIDSIFVCALIPPGSGGGSTAEILNFEHVPCYALYSQVRQLLRFAISGPVVVQPAPD